MFISGGENVFPAGARSDARYEVPRSSIPVSEIPRLGSGEPDRARLAALG